MGVRYVKGALFQAGTIGAARPQALVSEIDSNACPWHVAIEHVVLQPTWDATHTAPPSLFGQKFVLTPSGNRFVSRRSCSLHAWIWKRNPSGTFNPWNPSATVTHR